MNGEITGRRTTALLVAAVALAVLALVSVGLLLRGSGEVQAAPTFSPSPATSTMTATPSVTPSIDEPTLPTTARQPSRAGASAFASYFFRVYNYGYAALDADAVNRISSPACRYCRSVVTDIRQARSTGDRFLDGLVKVRVAVAAPGDPKQGLVVNLVLEQSAGTRLDRTGAVRETAAPVPPKRVDTLVQWTGDQWLMRGVDVVEETK